MAEKALLEENLQQKEAQEERLVEELEDLKVKAHQMQNLTAELDSIRVKHQELSEEHAILLRQKEHLSAGLGEREKGEWSQALNHASAVMTCYMISLVSLNIHLCNGCAQMCLLSVGHWLNLVPDAGLWVRV